MKIKIPTPEEIQAARKSLELTQEGFSEKFGLSLRSLQKWEQGVRAPEGGTATYLRLIIVAPDRVANLVSQLS